jgi:molybdopterin synthase catalytic subunit
MTNITVDVTPMVLDIEQYTRLVSDPGAGAIASFIGTTRGNYDGKDVMYLEYEAYVPMALKKLRVSCPRPVSYHVCHCSSNLRKAGPHE